MKNLTHNLQLRSLRTRIAISLATVLLAPAAILNAQSLNFEGVTGVYLNPFAYTAPSTEKGLGMPSVAWHILDGGNVLGNFNTLSVTEGAFNRLEFGYTRDVHSQGGNALSPVWSSGFNVVHAKFVVVPENAGKRNWLPAVSAGFIERAGVRNVGGYLSAKTTNNADFYLVASKTVTQVKGLPFILSGGVKDTNASLWGLAGNATAWDPAAFGTVAFVFKGPAGGNIILASEISQQRNHPQGLPAASIPTTVDYAVRIVPVKGTKLNVDLGVAQIAGKIQPGIDLQARARFVAAVSYGFGK